MSKYLLSFLMSFVFCLLSSAFGGIIRVPQDQLSIQAGINAAVNGDTVLVADSTYYENINFMGKSITVASYMIMDHDSTHRDSTIINGSQPTNPDIGSVVSFVSGEDTTSILYGFTITGGTGTLYDSDNCIGGGIYYANSGARITHNKIVANSVTNAQRCWGGGIGTFWQLHDLHQIIIEENVIESNTISGNDRSRGGGICLIQGKITHNKIRFNSCSSMTYTSVGGGIECLSDTTFHRALVVIDSNLITYNQTSSTQSAGIAGGVDIQFSNVHLVGNVISHNNVSGVTPFGCGIRLRFSKEISMVKDNIISHNSYLNGSDVTGGGLILIGTSGVTIQGNQFIENMSDYGGGISEQETVGGIISGNIFKGNIANSDGGGIFSISDTSAAIHNNLFVNNVAARSGGGINIWWNFHPQIINNTMVDNTAGFSGGGILINSDSVIVMNTILWGNSAPNGGQIYGNAQVVYCDVQGGWPGDGNVSKEPMLRGDSLVLSDSSSCIGAGISSYQFGSATLTCPSTCFLGNPRPSPAGTLPDMGACESVLPSPVVSLAKPISNNIPKSYKLKQNYPNPFNPSTIIEFTLSATEFVTLKIYNILGEEVATLVSERLAAGNYKYEWDASGFANGVYLYQLQAEDLSTSSGQSFVQTRKLILLK